MLREFKLVQEMRTGKAAALGGVQRAAAELRGYLEKLSV
jgi:hypothetical protein